MFSRELKKGSIQLLILALLENRKRHGYELGKLIEARSEGRLVFRLHSLYPTLCRMEEMGLLKSRWVEKPGTRRRRFYRLTARGRQALERKRESWSQYMQAVNQIVGFEDA